MNIGMNGVCLPKPMYKLEIMVTDGSGKGREPSAHGEGVGKEQVLDDSSMCDRRG